ncbi:hypothetical protein SVIOM342S_05004 [Streptomyces violaceorubidus]
MSWLADALGTPVPATARRWATGPYWYADLVAAALLEECERLLREGLRRDYVRGRSVEPALAGSLGNASPGHSCSGFGNWDELRTHLRPGGGHLGKPRPRERTEGGSPV